jgi:glutamyl-tRNA synthetase
MAADSVSDAPRVRFAPSPTGYFHVGGARTALFNWLFARQHGGVFILRIEDTDTERNREEWIDGISVALTWLGLDWDEGPYLQSERSQLYADAIGKLAAEGHVYYCDCTRDAVEARTRGRAAPGYDGFCRDRELGPGPGRALRFRTPDEGSTTVSDLVRGEVVFQHATIEDFVVVKSTGAPLFVLANAVDDMDMGVTHVIRGEEHLPNTPKAILVWQALGGQRLPVFAHLPVLVNEKRQKLSKRRDPVALEDYRRQGYLPDAMRNYLALLGWGPPDGQEIMGLDVMVRDFRLTDVTRSPAFFDVRKLTHFNGEYIRAMTKERFIEACQPWLESGPWPSSAFDPEMFSQMAPLVQERVATLAEVPAMVDFLFLDQPPIEQASWDKAITRDAEADHILDAAMAAYAVCPWTTEEIRAATLGVAEQSGRKLAKAQAPIRVAVTGRTVGPPLFESLHLLGRDRTLERLRAARDRLHGAESGPPHPDDRLT